MKKTLLVAASSIAMMAAYGPAAAGGHLNDHVCNGQCGDNDGNKNGWVDNGNGLAPRGLIVSGENGRADNGVGNGGENLDSRTPNKGGEDSAFDDDPN